MNESGGAGLSLRLAEFVTQTHEAAVPESALRAAARVVLDATGVMRAASGLVPEVQPFISMAAQAGPGGARVLGTKISTAPELAALANGAMAHALDYEDALDGAPLHPNASLVPAALALTQMLPQVSGRAFLCAIAIGCDVSCRIALCLRQRLEEGGWYPPPILGAFGAVAGAARLLSLSPRQLLDAWSMLLLQNSCAGEIKHDRDTVIRAVREAFPARIAVQSVLLARAGVRGFDAPLEGRNGFFRLFAGDHYDASTLFENLGRHWHIQDLSFKPWPSCRGTHAAIECALQLRGDVDWRAIREIHIEGSEVQRMLVEPAQRKHAPRTAIDAKFSLPFAVATSLVTGHVDLYSFGSPALGNRDVMELARLASFRARNDWVDRAVSGAVQIVLANGDRLRREILHPMGSPARPLTDEQLMSKFSDCAASALHPLDREHARHCAQRILHLLEEPGTEAVTAT